MPTASPEALYRGEEAPRRAVLAVLLGLAMPGLGHVYLGRLRTAFAVYAGAAGATAGYWVGAWHFDVFLPRAALIYGALLLYFEVALARATVRTLRALGGRVLLRGVHHPIVYAGLWLTLGLAPLWGGLGLGLGARLGLHGVGDTQAFPQLLPGDILYYDRNAYAAEPAQPGDLVVVQPPGRAETVLRVVAGSGTIAGVDAGVPVVDGQPMARRALGSVELAAAPRAATQRGPWQAEVEGRSPRLYPIFLVRDGERRDCAPRPVPPGHVFVLGDNRCALDGLDSCDFGPVLTTAILGRPLWILWSRDPADGHIRWERLGLPLG